MHHSIEALGIDRLSPQERLDLIAQIWASLEDTILPDDTPAWHIAELAKRRANAHLHPGDGKPWREVMDSLEQNL